MDNKNVSLYKDVMGNYPTGVTVITTKDKHGQPIGLTVNSFASVSLEPLLILWSIDKNASTYESFMEADKFAVHVLSGDQGDICSLFSTRGIDRFNQCEWKYSDDNLPIISEASGVLQCETFKMVEAGDHTILIGEVFDIKSENKDPLLYHRRNVGKIPPLFYNES